MESTTIFWVCFVGFLVLCVIAFIVIIMTSNSSYKQKEQQLNDYKCKNMIISLENAAQNSTEKLASDLANYRKTLPKDIIDQGDKDLAQYSYINVDEFNKSVAAYNAMCIPPYTNKFNGGNKAQST